MKISNFFSFLISSTIFFFIFSLQFSQLAKYNFNNIYITYTDFFFILLFVYCVVIFFKTKFNIFWNYIDFNYLDCFFFIILFFSITKIVINSFEIENIVELIKRMYLYLVYVFFKILINYQNKNIKIIVSSFISISIFSSVLILTSFIYFNYTSEPYIIELWTIKDNIINPVFDNPVHFRGFFLHYNMQAYIIIPGFLLLIAHYIYFDNKKFVIFLSFLSLIILYLIKSKILIIFIVIISPSLYFLYIKNNFLNKNKIYLLYFFIILITYFFFTNFLFLKDNIINSNNKSFFHFYYTSNSLLKLFNYDIYGSIFFKLKYIATLIALENFFFFDKHYFTSYNFNEFTQNPGIIKILNMEPHSLIFGSLVNYGLVGSIFYTLFYFYPIFNFKDNRNFKLIITKKTSFNIIAMFFLIESINSDINNLIFLMVIYSVINIKNKTVKW